MISPVSFFILAVALAQCHADAPYPPPGTPFEVYGPPPTPIVKELTVPLPKTPKLEDVPIATRMFKKIDTTLLNIPAAPKLDDISLIHTPVKIVKEILGAIPVPPKLEDVLLGHTPLPIFGDAGLKIIPSAPKLEALKFTPTILTPIFDALKHIPAAPKLDIIKFTPSIFTPIFEELRNIPPAPKLTTRYLCDDAEPTVPSFFQYLARTDISAFGIKKAGDLTHKPVDIFHKNIAIIPTAPKIESTLLVLKPAIHEDITSPLGPIPTAPKLDDGILVHKPAGLFGESDLRIVPAVPKLDDILSIHKPVVLFGGSYLKAIPAGPKLDDTLSIHKPVVLFGGSDLKVIPAGPKLDDAPLLHTTVDLFGGSHTKGIPTAPKLEDTLSIHKPTVIFEGSGLGVIPAAPKLGDYLLVHKPVDIFGESDLRVIPTAPKLDILKFTPSIFTPMFDALKKIPAAPKLDTHLTPLHPVIVQDLITPFVHIPAAPALDKLKIIPAVEHFEDLRNIPTAPKITESRVAIPSLADIEELLPKVPVSKVSEGPYPAPLAPYPPAVPHDVYGVPAGL